MHMLRRLMPLAFVGAAMLVATASAQADVSTVKGGCSASATLGLGQSPPLSCQMTPITCPSGSTSCVFSASVSSNLLLTSARMDLVAGVNGLPFSTSTTSCSGLLTCSMSVPNTEFVGAIPQPTEVAGTCTFTGVLELLTSVTCTDQFVVSN